MGFMESVKGLAEKVGNSFEKGAKSVSEGSKKIAEKSKVKREIASLEKEIKDAYCEIGKRFVELNPEPGEEYAENIDTIRNSSERLEKFRQLLASLEDKPHCAGCGAALGKNQKFCDKCGAKVERPEAPIIEGFNDNKPEEPAAAEAEAMPADAAEKVCPKCGDPVDDDEIYCEKCGEKVQD
ncbi:MAG: zinc ribbon domain-containing protein [Ruminococcus sp.]|nr:zinc ribbon domain-containing protein [Ruminococcus sp.]